jgi:molybdate transport system ATP-binding protein
MNFLEATMTIERPEVKVQADLSSLEGEIVAIVGPNGAGKSTLVSGLAGLTPLAGGKVVVDGRVWEDAASRVRLRPQRRSVGVMFQHLALFENMSVLENVAYGPRSVHTNKAKARKDAHATLEKLGAANLTHTPVGELSGGQAQKVALARALSMQPDVLLLDEPTSKLDVASRAEVRRSLSGALQDFAGVSLLVTHQPVEALALATRVIVLEEGTVTQQGAPTELQLRPRTSYVAQFVGVNLFEGRTSEGQVRLTGGAWVAVMDPPVGDVFVSIHPTAIALHRTRPEGTPRNVWSLEIADVDLEGGRVRVRLKGELTLVAEITGAAASQLRIEKKGAVWASVKATQIRVYPR